MLDGFWICFISWLNTRIYNALISDRPSNDQKRDIKDNLSPWKHTIVLWKRQ